MNSNRSIYEYNVLDYNPINKIYSTVKRCLAIGATQMSQVQPVYDSATREHLGYSRLPGILYGKKVKWVLRPKNKQGRSND